MFDIDKMPLNDFNGFKNYIYNELNLQDDEASLCFEQEFKGQSILTYLINKHDVENDMSVYIAWLLEKHIDLAFKQPIHLALHLGKMDIVDQLIKDGLKEAKIIGRDEQGKTAIYYFIDLISKGIAEAQILTQFIHNVFVNESTDNLSPLHQAIGSMKLTNRQDDRVLIQTLVDNGAQLDSVSGPSHDTPLAYAARLGNLKAVIQLLEIGNAEQHELILADGKHAMEICCEHLLNKKSPIEKSTVLAMIASLLCNGVDAPLRDDQRAVIYKHGELLLNSVGVYTKAKPELRKVFLEAAHDLNSGLSQIIHFDKKTVGSTDTLAFKLEELVTNEVNVENFEALDDAQKVAFFIQAYKEDYRNSFFTNPFSTTLKKITNKGITWEEIRAAATQDNPTSKRTARVYEGLFAPQQPAPVEIELKKFPLQVDPLGDAEDVAGENPESRFNNSN